MTEQLTETPESGVMKIQGVATLTRIYTGPLPELRRATLAPGTMGSGELDGWFVSKSIREETGETGKLTILWVTRKSPFSFRPGSVQAIQP